MTIIIIPLGFILWYLAYEAKPIINADDANLWEEENVIKRNKLLHILKGNF